MALPDAARFPATRSDLELLPAQRVVTECAEGMWAVDHPTRPDFRAGRAVYWALEADSEADLEEAAAHWYEQVERGGDEDEVSVFVEMGLARGIAAPDRDWRVETRTVLQRGPVAVTSHTAAPIAPPTPVSAIGEAGIRPCESLDDWDAVLRLMARAQPGSDVGFLTWRLEHLRRLTHAGLGKLWVVHSATDDGGSAAHACAGAFDVHGLWRFQDVICDPAQRRRGLARRLCSHVLARAGENLATVVAVRDSPAEGLYRQLGFEPARLQQLWTTPVRDAH